MKRKTQPKSFNKIAVGTFSKKTLVILLAIVLAAGIGTIMAKRYKNLVIVGKVNGLVVSRWELEKALNDRYAKTVFDDLASTTLLKQLAKKNDIVVSKDELKKEIEATDTRLGGKEALQATLDRLGYSQTRFEEEMRRSRVA